ERITGARSISNGLTLPELAAEGDWLKTRMSACRARRARTQPAAEGAKASGDLFRALRDHGGTDVPRYRLLNGAMGAACMHAGGLVAASQTTASWVSELRPGGSLHWVTGTAAPCTGLFKPVRVGEPLDLGPAPTDRVDRASLWWRHERLHRQVMCDPVQLGALFMPERDAVEQRWLESPPEPAAALDEADRLLAEWTSRVEAARARDTRPRWVRRYWNRRELRAGRVTA
ncbi:MAG TPA: hypothetical protein VLM41_03820, partial [Steroidobacteraceae bacterium]|nr:hypothetical protein [Steroidobacteraceae bacterium]